MSGKKFGKTLSPIQHLTLDGIFAALYVVFSVVLSIPVGSLEVSWASLPILLASLLLSPLDGMAVAFCGSFLEQILGPYGITATMPFWMLPVILQAAFASFVGRKMHRKFGTPGLVVTILISELLLTTCNIGVSYLDAYLLDYLAFLSIDIPLRFLNGGLRCLLSCLVIPYLLEHPLSGLLRESKKDT